MPQAVTITIAILLIIINIPENLLGRAGLARRAAALRHRLDVPGAADLAAAPLAGRPVRPGGPAAVRGLAHLRGRALHTPPPASRAHICCFETHVAKLVHRKLSVPHMSFLSYGVGWGVAAQLGDTCSSRL